MMRSCWIVMMLACQDGRCMASKVNSANNCYNTVLRSKAVANSSIVVDYLQSGIYRVRIKAPTLSWCHSEVYYIIMLSLS
jgi:hypothetical protein